MAIISTAFNPKGDRIYAGMVVKIYTKQIKIWSDVWDDATYAVVYDIITDQVSEHLVRLGYDGVEKQCEVDASPELQQKYIEHLVREERKIKMNEIIHNHSARWNEIHNMNITLGEYKKLKRFGTTTYEILSGLLSTKKFRSKFRENLAQQVRDWLKEENPKYSCPLSPRQLECADNRRSWQRGVSIY